MKVTEQMRGRNRIWNRHSVWSPCIEESLCHFVSLSSFSWSPWSGCPSSPLSALRGWARSAISFPLLHVNDCFLVELQISLTLIEIKTGRRDLVNHETLWSTGNCGGRCGMENAPLCSHHREGWLGKNQQAMNDTLGSYFDEKQHLSMLWSISPKTAC